MINTPFIPDSPESIGSLGTSTEVLQRVSLIENAVRALDIALDASDLPQNTPDSLRPITEPIVEVQPVIETSTKLPVASNIIDLDEARRAVNAVSEKGYRSEAA